MPFLINEMLIPGSCTHDNSMPSHLPSQLVCAVSEKDSLRLDLAVGLDGELVVGLEGRDGVVWDLGAWRVLACVCVGMRVAYVKPLIRVNSWTWVCVSEDLVGRGRGLTISPP